MMVIEEDRKESVLRAMSDPYMRKILLSTVDQSRTALEISADVGIPISTCYRKIHELLSLRLLRIERILLYDGKKIEKLRSRVRSATVNFSTSEVLVDVTLVPREPEEKLTDMWNSLSPANKVQLAVAPVG